MLLKTIVTLRLLRTKIDAQILKEDGTIYLPSTTESTSKIRTKSQV